MTGKSRERTGGAGGGGGDTGRPAETGPVRPEEMEETLDRERHGSGDFDPHERYGRNDTAPDRTKPEPGDEPTDAEETPAASRLSGP